jgi:TRAP-type mannitol/chloroaromatic compound transport system substrate-binding protein
MLRRSFLKGSIGASTAAASALSAPAIAQGIKELDLVTSWPQGLPGLGTSAERLAKRIADISGGRLRVRMFAAGEMMGAFEVFDAVSAGLADMYHSAEYYWVEKSPAFAYFCTVPYGLTANELNSWIYWGGGQELWDELSAQHDIKPLLASNTGVQMGGWFNKEITSVDSFKGLKFRMPGLGGKVLSRLGAIVINVPGGKIVNSLRSGAIDASEWVGPWNDLELGLHTAGKYYYYPGFHEPGTALALGVNKGVWDGLSDEERQVISASAAMENSQSVAFFHARNSAALHTLVNEHAVQVRKFDDSVLEVLGQVSGEVMAETAQHDPLTQRVHESFLKFRKSSIMWGDLSERAYLNARSLRFSYGD